MAGFKRRSPTDLANKLQDMTNRQDFSDAAEWKLSTDKLGNGSAVIRFLPPKEEDGVPFVKIYAHGFKEKGKWFIENCPTTIGEQACPVCSANSELWNSGIESNKDLARQRKRKLSYWANIVVIKDEAKPDNEGKVFKYRFGSKILEKIAAASESDPDLGTEGFDPTCVFEGANFLLKAKRVSNFPNYDDSKFGKQSELFDGDEDKLGAVYDELHDLSAIVAPKEFKTETELKAKLAQVLGAASAAPSAASQLDGLDDLDGLTEQAPARQAQRSVEQAPAASADDEFDDLLNELGV